MKKTILGTIFSLLGINIYIGISKYIYGEFLITTTYYTYIGKYLTAVIRSKMLIPFIIATSLFFIGILILLIETYDCFICKKKNETKSK